MSEQHRPTRESLEYDLRCCENQADQEACATSKSARVIWDVDTRRSLRERAIGARQRRNDYRRRLAALAGSRGQ